MNIHHVASHVFIAGKSGMGKTTFGLNYIKGTNHTRVFIYDHQGEFAPRLGIKPSDVAIDADSFAALAENNRIVPFDFSTLYGGYKNETFAWFCDLCFETAKHIEEKYGGSCLFVCDEIQQFVSTSDCPVEFKAIVETGRRWNFDTLTLTQRPNAVNGAIREQFTEMILFRLQDERSLKFIGEIGGDVDAIMNLPPHSYLYYNVIKGEERTGKIHLTRKV